MPALAVLFALAIAALAQEPPVPAEKKSASSPAAAPAAAADAPAATSGAEPAASAASSENSEVPLRRLDQPELKKDEPRDPDVRRRGGRNRRSNSGEFPIGDHYVPKGSDIRDAVSVFGSTTVDGEVHSDAVSVFGDTVVGPEAKVGGAAVSVLGHLLIDGTVAGEAVSVLGRADINGTVGDEVVSVLGDLTLGPKAVVNGDLVIVGGKLRKDPNAIVHGNEVNVPILGGFGGIEWLTAWLKQCAFKGRLLAFGPHLGWAWMVAFSFLAFYLLLAVLFPSVIEKCALTLETRPGSSILASVLTVLLTPVAIVLLAVTIVGGLLIPFVAAGLFFAGLFGKAVMLAWIGRRFTKFFRDGPLGHPVFAVLIGGVIVLLLYTVWGSVLLYKLLSWLGLGVVVYTIALSMKREKAAPPIVPAPAPASPGIPINVVPPVGTVESDSPVSPIATPLAATPDIAAVPPVPDAPTMPTGFSPPLVSPGFGSPAVPNLGGTASDLPPISAAPTSSMPPPSAPVSPPPLRPAASFGARPPVASAAIFPRAGFFLRLAAMALDGLLVALIVGFLSSPLPRLLQFHHGPSGLLLCLAIYAAVMWKTKATTIGGIVCGLKVVRIDHREIDWPTAVVRALSCFLSLAAAGLGFIWVAFDDEKQSWHDKIAGTTVVHVPKGVSLL